MKTSPEIPKASGIYRISIGPRTFYWGQSQDLRGRLASHLCDLRMGTHDNSRLQRSFDKHGEDAFTFEVSLLCPAEDLNMQEQLALDIYHGTSGCANIAKVAEASMRGLTLGPQTEEHRAKISEAKRGRAVSAEHAEATRKGHLARNPNIRVGWAGGSEEIWPSQKSLACHLGLGNSGLVCNWLAGRRPIPAKYNIASISRTELPATIKPEAL